MDLTFAHIALLYGVLLVSLVVHEAAHALFALLGGDRTAYVGGQVTLNPLPHIRREPFGTVILPLLMLFLSKSTGGLMFLGYAYTPIDAHWAYRHPRRAALMSAAGPLANVLLAAIAFAVLETLILTGAAETDFSGRSDIEIMLCLLRPTDGSVDGPMFALISMASVFLWLNILLAVLNIFPVPPFDGAGVVEGLFPRQTRGFYAFFRSQPMLFLLSLFLLWQILPKLYFPITNFVLQQL